jgi:hypothetical protein
MFRYRILVLLPGAPEFGFKSVKMRSVIDENILILESPDPRAFLKGWSLLLEA